MLDKLITGEKLVDEWDTLGAKRIELNVYQRQGKIYSGNILLLCPTHTFTEKNFFSCLRWNRFNKNELD